MCSNASVAHTQDEPPAASIMSPIGAPSKRRRSFALASRDDALEMTPWPWVGVGEGKRVVGSELVGASKE